MLLFVTRHEKPGLDTQEKQIQYIPEYHNCIYVCTFFLHIKSIIYVVRSATIILTANFWLYESCS